MAAATKSKQQRYSCPGLTEKQSALVGPELRKIAESQKVNDIRSLNAETVWRIVEADKTHPLRELYDFDKNKAARAHWIEQTRRMISGIRVITVDMPERRVYEPMFLNAAAPTKKEGSSAIRRSHVMRADVLANDPVFMSALGSQIRRMEQALSQAEHLAASRTVPPYMRELLASVREALSRYQGVGMDVAAQ